MRSIEKKNDLFIHYERWNNKPFRFPIGIWFNFQCTNALVFPSFYKLLRVISTYLEKSDINKDFVVDCWKWGITWTRKWVHPFLSLLVGIEFLSMSTSRIQQPKSNIETEAAKNCRFFCRQAIKVRKINFVIYEMNDCVLECVGTLIFNNVSEEIPQHKMPLRKINDKRSIELSTLWLRVLYVYVPLILSLKTWLPMWMCAWFWFYFRCRDLLSLAAAAAMLHVWVII